VSVDVAARPALPRRNRANAALLGMAALIASELMLFVALIGTYYYLRFNTPIWPPSGVPEPEWIVPVILVCVLVCSGIPMQLGSRAVQDGRLAAARLFFLAALVLQAGYFAYEVHDFADQLHDVPIATNAYTSIYYVLLGADHAHVLVGILLVGWLLAKLVRGLTLYREKAARAITWYWHFVYVLTIVVLATLLSARA
jgi:heme/copper-type cytochrome/quinol oxidase subunit 3